MEVIVDQKQLSKALSVIKKSNAFSKLEGEDEIPLLIEVTNDDVSFLVSNVAFWSKAIIGKNQENDDNSDLLRHFEIKKTGKIFVDGSDFIGMIATYPEQSIIKLSVEEKNKGHHLMAETLKIGNKKRVKRSGFVSVKPSYFEEFPPNENRKEKKVNTKELRKAVEAVEAITSTEEMLKYLWGIKLEIFGREDIASVSSNKMKICWYDKKGAGRKIDKDPISVCPIKSGILSVVKSLNDEQLTKIEIGKQYTVLTQPGQWHAVPNAIQSGSERMPDWRTLSLKMSNECKTIVKIERDALVNGVKTSNLATGGKFGIRIMIDTKKGEIKTTLNSVGNDTIIKSYHEEEGVIEQENIEGEPFKDSFVITIEDLRDVLNKFSGELVKFEIKDSKSPIQISDEKEHLCFITSLVRSAICQV